MMSCKKIKQKLKKATEKAKGCHKSIRNCSKDSRLIIELSGLEDSQNQDSKVEKSNLLHQNCADFLLDERDFQHKESERLWRGLGGYSQQSFIRNGDECEPMRTLSANKSESDGYNHTSDSYHETSFKLFIPEDYSSSSFKADASCSLSSGGLSDGSSFIDSVKHYMSNKFHGQYTSTDKDAVSHDEAEKHIGNAHLLYEIGDVPENLVRHISGEIRSDFLKLHTDPETTDSESEEEGVTEKCARVLLEDTNSHPILRLLNPCNSDYSLVAGSECQSIFSTLTDSTVNTSASAMRSNKIHIDFDPRITSSRTRIDAKPLLLRMVTCDNLYQRCVDLNLEVD